MIRGSIGTRTIIVCLRLGFGQPYGAAMLHRHYERRPHDPPGRSGLANLCFLPPTSRDYEQVEPNATADPDNKLSGAPSSSALRLRHCVFVGGNLDERVGGPPQELTAAENKKRTIYSRIRPRPDKTLLFWPWRRGLRVRRFHGVEVKQVSGKGANQGRTSTSVSIVKLRG